MATLRSALSWMRSHPRRVRERRALRLRLKLAPLVAPLQEELELAQQERAALAKQLEVLQQTVEQVLAGQTAAEQVQPEVLRLLQALQPTPASRAEQAETRELLLEVLQASRPTAEQQLLPALATLTLPSSPPSSES